MSRQLQDHVSEISPLIRERTGGTVESSDVKNALNRGIRFLVNECGIYATKNWQTLKVFPTVREYPLPSDFGDFINLQSRTSPLFFTRKDPEEFWTRQNTEDQMVAVDTIQGTRYLLVKASSAGSAAVLHDCESLTSNGTWAADTSGSDATNLTLDVTQYMTGSGALNFDVDVSQSVNDYAVLTNSTMTAVDLSDMNDDGILFAWVYLPTVTNFTSITFRWGSSSSAYYSNTATAQYNGQAWRVGWNRVGVAWSGATTTGSPVDTSIGYLYVKLTYSASFADTNGFLIDDIRMETPDLLEHHYYSTNFCQTSSGVPRENFSADDDTSLLASTDDDVLFYYALMDAMAIKEVSDRDLKMTSDKFQRALVKLKARYPSERRRAVKRWY